MIKTIGKWEKGTLIWHFYKNETLIHKTSNSDLIAWCNENFDIYDRPYDGIIRQLHTQKYIEEVIAKG